MNSNLINSNIKKLREDLNLNQTEFGNKLKVSNTTISKIEKLERNATDRLIMQICDTFNVNEEWIKTGQGEMYRNNKEVDISSIVKKVMSSEDEFLKNVFLTFYYLNDEERKVIKKVIDQLSRK